MASEAKGPGFESRIAHLLIYITIQFFPAFRTKAVTKINVCVFPNVRFYLNPVALIVPVRSEAIKMTPPPNGFGLNSANKAGMKGSPISR